MKRERQIRLAENHAISNVEVIRFRNLPFDDVDA
jgi:hypothetical protein